MARGNRTRFQHDNSLAQLMEARLGGMMLVRIGWSNSSADSQEERALAMSLKTILQLRDEERNAKAQLESARVFAPA